MKKLIVFAAAAMMASPALASKARVNALGNSRQLTDVQYVFDRPYLLHSVGEQVTMEWGDSAATNTKAEAGIIKNMGEGVFGLYLGRTGYLTEAVNTAATGQIVEQNPINVLYGAKAGDIAWGVNFAYSNGKTDTLNAKASSMGLTAGATNGVWEAELGLGLGSKSEDDNGEIKVASDMVLGVGYNIDETKHAYLTYNSKKIDGADGMTEMSLGFINTVAKTEDANLFYGVAYNTSDDKDADSKSSKLPVWIGVEANATSWMVMRASVSQSILINSTETAGAKSDLDSIAFAAGAGFKLGKGMLDATFATADAGHLSFGDGTAANQQFLSNVSYTYMF